MINLYRKGVRFEREIVNFARKKGLNFAGRTAGSHSPLDVYIINPDTKEVFFIQAKKFKRKSNRKPSQALIKQIGSMSDEYFCKFIVIQDLKQLDEELK